MSRSALAVLALIAELAGRSLAHRLDVGRQVGPVSYAHESYYPFVLAVVKVGAALMLARVAWRFARARRVASLIGASPRVRVELSARLWFVSFATTSLIFLVQMDVEHVIMEGCRRIDEWELIFEQLGSLERRQPAPDQQLVPFRTVLRLEEHRLPVRVQPRPHP